MIYPRVHPAPMETCGAVADYDVGTEKMTIWMTSQAPHAHRTLAAIVTGLPEQQIRIISPDIGGGFGNKVPIYPGTCAWPSPRSCSAGPSSGWSQRAENLMSTSFARDYHMVGEIAANEDGNILGVRVDVLSDHGAFNAHAQPGDIWPMGFFAIFPSCYDAPAAYAEATGVYSNKAPAVSPTAARSGSQRPSTSWSAPWTSWPTSSAWTRSSCAARTSSPRRSSPTSR
jgi:carbon-monoxide dehydrogenase large subunit